MVSSYYYTFPFKDCQPKVEHSAQPNCQWLRWIVAVILKMTMREGFKQTPHCKGHHNKMEFRPGLGLTYPYLVFTFILSM